MLDVSTIVKSRQKAIRRAMDRRGILMKCVAMDSDIPPSTLATYFPEKDEIEPHGLTVAALYAICEGEALPAELLSLLLPKGWQVIRAPEEIDHAAVEQLALDFYAGSAADNAESGTAPVGKLRVAV